jgi:2-haloalkanoic acid dehalogenase type II
MKAPLITFDVFSALINSRHGGGRFLQSLADQRDWPSRGADLYDDWDARNKHAQAQARSWVTFAQLAEHALRATYKHYALPGDVHADCLELLASIAGWPLWPDVEPALAAIGRRYRLGILSNVDDDILASSKVWPLIDPANALTSQRLGCYKPDPRIYVIARDRFGVQLHVAASARDVRGAGEAKLPYVRVARPGHHVDPDGPEPTHTITDLRELAEWPRAPRHFPRPAGPAR